MCGRFKLDKNVEELIKHFNVALEKDAEPFAPNSNASPGQFLPVITSNEPDKFQMF